MASELAIMKLLLVERRGILLPQLQLTVRRCGWAWAACFVAALASSPLSAQELRGLWVDAFNPGCRTQLEIDQLLRDARRANFNALFVQMRKSGDAYYQSRYDPWAADNPERFDALAYLCSEAKKGPEPLQIHAWLNTFAVGRSRGNPLHITEQHPDWKSLSYRGANHDGEANKVDPGHPGAFEWTFRMYLDVLRHYPVDGIHFDFVRYGSTGGQANWGYSPAAVERFNRRFGRNGTPHPSDPVWKQWRRDQVTALVRKVYAFAATIRPEAVVSAATIAWGDGPKDRRWWNDESPAMQRVLQDWPAWIREGILDLNCPMTYFSEKRRRSNHQLWTRFARAERHGKHVAPAVGAWLNPATATLRQIERIRTPGPGGSKAQGVMLYSYAGISSLPGERRGAVLDKLASGPFRTPATPPAMAWKRGVRDGLLKGFVFRNHSLEPADGVVVQIEGPVMRRVRTDGTGFWAVFGLPRGDYRIAVTGERRVGPPSTAAVPGPETHVTLVSGAPLAKSAVVAGTDLFPGHVVLEDLDSPRHRRPVTLLTPSELSLQAGDVVAIHSGGSIHSLWERADSPARLVDIQPIDREGPNRPRELELANSGQTYVPRWAWYSGKVKSKGRNDIVVAGPIGDVRVEFLEVKGPGTEDPVSFLPMPTVGAWVTVMGAGYPYSAGRNGATIWAVKIELKHTRSGSETSLVSRLWYPALLGALVLALLAALRALIRERRKEN